MGNKIELETCPFCNTSAETRRVFPPDMDGAFYDMHGCPKGCASKSSVEEWNKRVPLEELRSLVKEQQKDLDIRLDIEKELLKSRKVLVRKLEEARQNIHSNDGGFISGFMNAKQIVKDFCGLESHKSAVGASPKGKSGLVNVSGMDESR